MIFGSYSLKGTTGVMPHIGGNDPDHEGLIFNPVTRGGFDGGYYLHERLPLKSSDIHFYDDNEDLLVLISGSVYNRQELSELFGISKQLTDPAMVAAMFIGEGPGFVKKLNGDFAIFIVQTEKRRAYLFRDHAGIRPLAYTADRTSLLFSTDVTALCRALPAGNIPESEYLLGYFKCIDYRMTPDRRVRKLLPGHYLRFSEEGLQTVKYWDPGKIRTDRKLQYGEMLTDLKALVSDAVMIRCDRRYNAGSHVSSGLDSGIVAALARKEYPQQEDFPGFSWSPADFTGENLNYDERDLIRTLCAKADIKPVFSDMTCTGFLRYVSDFYNNHGFFFEDRTTDQAAQRGVNLIFSGWGGDEFISTGDRGIETDLLTGPRLKTYFKRNHVRPLKRFVKYFLHYTLYPAFGILQGNVVKSFKNDARYIKRPFKRSDRKALRNFYFHTSRRQMHLRLLDFYHLQDRCEHWAKSGFLKGIEYRYPLLDKRIIEYMLKVPSVLLCRTDHFRPLLRLIGEDILPEDVRLNRSKKDPVHSAFWEELLRESAYSLSKEVNDWKGNCGLHFVDFELLDRDIRQLDHEPESVDTKVLFRALVYLKAIHEFTVCYRR